MRKTYFITVLLPKFLLINILIFSCAIIFAQDSDAEIIKRAMHDEMQRNLDSLNFKDFSKPFFIGYTFTQNEFLNISATLGAITTSNHSKSNNNSVRLMVGDYHLNDENYYSYSSFDNGFSSSYLPTPLDIDYFGIRRSFWASTDAVYKSAGENFKTKLAVMEKHNVTKEDYLIPDFSKAQVVNMEIPIPNIQFEKEKLETLARKLSSIFLDYPDIIGSGISISVEFGKNYFINSEGTEVIQPVVQSSISAYARTEVEKGPNLSNSFEIYVLDPKDFPDEAILSEKIKSMADFLMTLKEAPVYEDIYTGPILFEGEAAADLFSSTLFGYSGLVASRPNMSENANTISIPDKPELSSLEAKIGKKIIHKNLSIIATPKIKSFNGKSLLGTFEVDGEGVIPPDTLTLVKDGMLETLLNGRTPSILIGESNGHNRLGGGYGISRSVSPGVIQVIASETKTREELIQQIIEIAEEEDLEYVFIVKGSSSFGFFNPTKVYKYNIADGTEELVRGVSFGSTELKLLKKIKGVSNNTFVSNIVSSGSYLGGGLSSYIVPDVVLIKEMEIEGSATSSTNKLPIVENPLKKIN